MAPLLNLDTWACNLYKYVLSCFYGPSSLYAGIGETNI